MLQAFERLVSEGYATARSGAGTRVATTLSATAHRRSSIRVERSGPRAPDRAPRLSRSALAIVDEFKNPHPPFRMAPFALGVPALDEFPVALWSRLIGRLWRTRSREMLGITDVRGYPPLREAIAQYVMTARGVRCSADQVVVVNGAQHGIDIMARVLLDPGDTAWVEDPGWRPMRATLRAAGATLVRVPVDEQGIDVYEGERRAPNARLALVTPSYQAPLGVALTLERRLALLDWAARADAWVLEDDYNGEYRYDTDPIPAVQALDRAGRVIYVGSFSKTVAPGLRVGYVVLPPSLVSVVRLARLASDMNTSVAEQAVLAEFLAGGHFARHIPAHARVVSAAAGGHARAGRGDRARLARDARGAGGDAAARAAPARCGCARGELGGGGARCAGDAAVAIGAHVDHRWARGAAARLRGVRARRDGGGVEGARAGNRGESGGAVARRTCREYAVGKQDRYGDGEAISVHTRSRVMAGNVLRRRTTTLLGVARLPRRFTRKPGNAT